MARLLERDASVLVVIDAQPRFLEGDAASPVDAIVARVAWLVGVAVALDVPIVVTEEAPDRNGSTHPDIAARLPAGTPVHTKPTFGLADVPTILAGVEATGRDTAVLVGMETDVCVAQSALGLLDRGLRVAVWRTRRTRPERCTTTGCGGSPTPAGSSSTPRACTTSGCGRSMPRSRSSERILTLPHRPAFASSGCPRTRYRTPGTRC